MTGTGSDREFDAFDCMHRLLSLEKRFESGRGPAFFREVQRRARLPERYSLRIAWAGDEAVAGHLGVITGMNATVLLSAATDRGRAVRASYLLHWQFMTFARDHGAVWLDLGGIDPAENPSVYSFKKGMRAEELRWAGYFDHHPHRFPIRLLHRLEALARR